MDISEYHDILYNCKKPYQYVGGEYLSFNKSFDEAKVRFALAFPDKYEIGISNLGVRVIFKKRLLEKINHYTHLKAKDC